MNKNRLYTKLYSNTFLAFVVLLTMLSCHRKEVQQPVIASPLPTTDTTIQIADTTQTTDTATGKTYLALGDSYTIGQSVDSAERFPAQTAALLGKQNIRFTPIQYIATTGWTTVNLMNAINLQQPKGPFDVVSLLIGVNDQYQTHDTTNYRSRFTDLINTAISLAGNFKSHVFVVSIPDYGVTPFGGNNKDISKQIDEFNAINKEVTRSYSISYTDVTAISRSDAGDASMIAADGLHPSGNQYAQWAQALEPAVFEVLK